MDLKIRTIKPIKTGKALGLVLFLSTIQTFVADAAFGKADPFAGVSAKPLTEPSGGDFFTDNFGFRKEVMSEFSTDARSEWASRQSVGFEILKKFSSETSTFLSLDLQGRLVRRDGFAGAPNDMEGMDRPGWSFEVHNAYLDLYDPLGGVGNLNFRVGRFYIPFGLNLQTDTHGSILQLSNEANFGFERDWYLGFWGSLGPDLNYDAYYLVGSGYDLQFRGQGGSGALRLSLGNRVRSEKGLEGGVSFLRGGRLSAGSVVDTLRAGIDGRWRTPGLGGTWAWTSELSGGTDSSEGVFTQLHQLDYLRASRRWGLSAQYRRFSHGFQTGGVGSVGSTFSGEATWYFRNDVSGSNLQWVKLNAQWPMEGPVKNMVLTLQYYQYW